MCGIAGVAHERKLNGRETEVSSMVRLMGHRGPAGAGVWSESVRRWDVELGHTRLAILDLTDAASQPMVDPESGCVLVFNGEIYNFAALRKELEAAGRGPIRSSGDTEVLLKAYALWGEKCVGKLKGMFAFAVYDPAAQRLFLARDPFGIKPLYTVQGLRGQFAFASEVRALLQLDWVRRDLDPIGILGYLGYGSVQDPYTLVAGIRSLMPGHTLTIQLGDGNLEVGRPRQYWQFSSFARNGRNDSYEDLAERVHSVLAESVRLHLISDAPLGIFLSGGLDSSSILALASGQNSRPLESVNVSFDEPEFDESDAASEIASHFGSRHTNVKLTANAFLNDLPQWLESQDQPSMDGANTWVVSRASKQLGLTVALSGLGGDELFAGYPTFQNTALAQRLSLLLRWLPAGIQEHLAASVAIAWRKSIHTSKLAAWLKDDRSVLSTYLMLRRLFLNSTLQAMLSPGINDLGLNRFALPAEGYALLKPFIHDPDVIRAVGMLEMSTYMRNTLLRDSDQMGMAHSLEIRVPFIDREVIESVGSLTGRVRTRGGAPKPLLAASMRAQIRRRWARRPKKPFSFPFDAWLRGPLKGAVGEALDQLPSPLFTRETVRSSWADFLRGRPTIHSSHILSLYTLTVWLRRHKITGF